MRRKNSQTRGAAPRLPRQCRQVRKRIVAAVADGQPMPGDCRRHIEACEACRRFADSLDRASAMLAADAPALPREAPAYVSSIPARPLQRWTSVHWLTAAASAVVVFIAIVLAVSQRPPAPASPEQMPQRHHSAAIASATARPQTSLDLSPRLPEVLEEHSAAGIEQVVSLPGRSAKTRRVRNIRVARRPIRPRQREVAVSSLHDSPALREVMYQPQTPEIAALASPPVILPRGDVREPNPAHEPMLWIEQTPESTIATVLHDVPPPHPGPVTWVEQTPEGGIIQFTFDPSASSEPPTFPAEW